MNPSASVRRVHPVAMPFAMPFAMSVVALVITVAPTARAHAEDRPDGVYGRLSGDAVFSLEGSGGVAVTPRGVAPVIAATVRARALDMAGVFAGYQYAFAAERSDAVVFGVEMRPAVFARIFQDMEDGPRWSDLLIDSIGIELGGAWIRPGDRWGAGSGLGFVLGTGADLPLAWNPDRGHALGLRLGVRWVHAADWDVQSPGVAMQANDSLSITLGLVGRLTTRLGLVDPR